MVFFNIYVVNKVNNVKYVIVAKQRLQLEEYKITVILKLKF